MKKIMDNRELIERISIWITINFPRITFHTALSKELTLRKSPAQTLATFEIFDTKHREELMKLLDTFSKYVIVCPDYVYPTDHNNRGILFYKIEFRHPDELLLFYNEVVNPKKEKEKREEKEGGMIALAKANPTILDVLRFYANKDNYIQDGLNSVIEWDKGDIARTAIKKLLDNDK